MEFKHELIRQHRERLGLSQAALADKINGITGCTNLTRQHVSKWEGGTQPLYTTGVTLCVVLGIGAIGLLGRSE